MPCSTLLEEVSREERKVRPCASDRDPKGRDYAAALTIAPLHGQARNETSGQDQAQRKGRGIGSGRRSALAGRSLERGPSGRAVQGDKP